MKVVKNVCFGCFGLSDLAVERLAELTGKPAEKCRFAYDCDDKRCAPELVQVVEELGDDASAGFANLEIVEVPDDVDWYIDDYDGMETICEQHREW